MAETVVTCSRCGKLIQGEPPLVVAQSGPRAPAQPVINLCTHCADSMSRWFARRHHAREPDRAAQRTEQQPDSSSGCHHHHGHRQHRRWRRRRRRLIRGALAIAYVFITFAILSFVGYQVWRLSSNLF